MTVFNRISEFIDQRGISRYRFWQDTQLGRDTAYRLCNDPSYIPTGAVLDKICSAYRMQPGDFLEWREENPNEDNNPNIAISGLATSGSSKHDSSIQASPNKPKDSLKLIEERLPIIRDKVS